MKKKNYVAPEVKPWDVRGREKLLDNSVSCQSMTEEAGAWTKEEKSETVGIWDLY